MIAIVHQLLLWFVVTTLGVCSATAQLSYYTSATKGSKVKVPSVMKGSGGVIIHVDSKSCTACLLNTQTVFRLAKTKGLPVAVYAHVGSESEFESIREQFPGTQIVNDELDAYANLYKVRHYPVIMVVSSEGIIGYVGAPGGTKTFDVDACIRAIEALLTHEKPSKPAQGAVRLFETIVNVENTNNHRLSPYCTIRYCQQTGTFVTLDPNTKTLHLLTKDGSISKSISVHQPAPDFVSYRPSLIARSETGDSVLMSDSDIRTAAPILYWLNLKTEQITIVPITLPSTSRLMASKYLDAKSKTLWMSQRPPDPAGSNHLPALSLLRLFGDGTIDSVGGYARELLNIYCPNFYSSKCAGTNDYVVRLEGLSKELTLFPRNGTKPTIIALKYPKEHTISMIPRISRLTPESTLETIKSIADSAQAFYQIFGIPERNEVAIVSLVTTNHYPELANTRTNTHVMNLSIHDAKNGECKHFWLLPEGISPQEVIGTTLYATDFGGAKQRIVAMKLP